MISSNSEGHLILSKVLDPILTCLHKGRYIPPLTICQVLSNMFLVLVYPLFINYPWVICVSWSVTFLVHTFTHIHVHTHIYVHANTQTHVHTQTDPPLPILRFLFCIFWTVSKTNRDLDQLFYSVLFVSVFFIICNTILFTFLPVPVTLIPQVSSWLFSLHKLWAELTFTS